jgi:hypothetical protein
MNFRLLVPFVTATDGTVGKFNPENMRVVVGNLFLSGPQAEKQRNATNTPLWRMFTAENQPCVRASSVNCLS